MHGPLLERMLADPYFSLPAPKSTGRGYFGEGWIDEQLRSAGRTVAPVDVQRSLCELTARDGGSVHRGIRRADGRGLPLRRRGTQPYAGRAPVKARLSPRKVMRTDVLGISADYVEAAAFAWLAKCALEGIPGNRPSVTGASEPVVLGGIYPGRLWPGRPGNRTR